MRSSQASAFLREVHKNVRLYWTDNTEVSQAIGGDEVDLAWAWNETGRDAAEGWHSGRGQTGYGGRSFHLGLRLCPAEGRGRQREAMQYDFLNSISDPASRIYGQ